jgi:hypothetical protein
MFDELVLPERAELRRGADGQVLASLKLRLPWYRALPISCIDGLDIAIDGAPVDPAQISIGLGDGYHSLAEAQSLDNTWWFVLDTAEMRISDALGLEAGDHTVGISLGLRIPYSAEPRAITFSQTAEHTRSVHFEGWDL